MKIRFFLFVAFALTSYSANADLVEQTARTEHMQACLEQGGQKDICMCSYEKASKLFGVQELLDLNRRIQSRFGANPEKVDLLAKVTASCVKDVRNNKYKASSSQFTRLPNQASSPKVTSAIPVPPPPPSLNPPSKQVKAPKIAESVEEDVKKQESFTRIYADNTNVPEDQYLMHKNSINNDSVYFKDYERVFFDSVMKGDIRGLIAGENVVPNMNIKNEQGNTPLMVAAYYNQKNSVQFLLDRKAKVNERNPSGQTALHIASYSGNDEIVKMLLDAKAKISESYGPGYQPIHLAVLSQSIPTIEVLLANKADIDAEMFGGVKPIHISVKTNKPEIVNFLISQGANIDSVNNIGQTPLMLAVQENKPNIVQILLAQGANPYAIDALGKNAITIAQERGLQNILNIFMSYQENIRLQQLGIR